MPEEKPSAYVYLDQNNLFFRFKKLDFKKLLDKLNHQFDVVRATSYMALDTKQESQKKFLTYLSNSAWKCYTVDIGTSTNIDGVIITDMMNDYGNFESDWVILLSGDGDYAYTLDMLAKRGSKICVIGSKDYVSLELLKVADKILYLEEEFSDIILEVNKM